MLLLAPLLGRGSVGRVGFLPPRSDRIRRALGLIGGVPALGLTGRIMFVFGDDDPHTAAQDRTKLAALGYSVTVLPGAGHRLDHPRMEYVIHNALSDLIAGSAATAQ
jgi:hypothetical protein